MPKLFVITGPSGAGKTTIAHELLRQMPKLKKVVTYTTRAPRPHEQNGVDYHFVDEKTFEQIKKCGEFFEWAAVYSRQYGSRIQDIENLLEQAGDVLMVVDVQGAKTVKNKKPKAVQICVLADSPEILIKRLEHRDNGETDNLEVRLNKLVDELAYAKTCEHLIINRQGEMPAAVAQIKQIIAESSPPQSFSTN